MNPNSKLPSHILQSIQSNPIVDYNPMGVPDGSVLDNSDPRLNEMLNKTKNLFNVVPMPKQNGNYAEDRNAHQNNNNYGGDEIFVPSADMIKENLRKTGQLGQQQSYIQTPQYSAQPQQQYQPAVQPQSGGGIDYSILNSLIRTAISEELNKVKGSLLTENTKGGGNEVNFLSIGSVIRFVSKDGNIYEGKLTKVGNTNNK